MNHTHLTRKPSRVLPFLVVGVLALAAAGCGGKGNVSGKVTSNNKTVVYGTVTLLAKDGLQYPAQIFPDGSFAIYDVPVGEVRIAVVSPDPEVTYQTLVSMQKNPESAAAIPKPAVSRKDWFPIHHQYAVPETSGLAMIVKRGENSNFDIVLELVAEPPAIDPNKRPGDNRLIPREPIAVPN